MQGKLQIQLQFKKIKIDISKFNVEVVINFFHFIIIGYKLVYSTFNVAIKIPKVRGRKIMFIQVFLFIYISTNTMSIQATNIQWQGEFRIRNS